MKKRICVLFTGGTIGSSYRDGTVNLDGGSSSLLIRLYRERFGEEISFEELHPVTMLSENVQISKLEKIADCIRALSLEDYDGIIVTHGTDTLCFTANLFSQLFCDIEKPLVFVSSLYPLEDERSNGLDNFAGAVSFIAEGYPGVYVCFKNQNGKCKIQLASRLTYAEQFDGSYNSVLDASFGEMEDGVFTRSRHPLNPLPEEIRTPRKKCETQTLSNEIVTIKGAALLDFSYYRFDRKKPGAVIIELYHSGTICTEGEETNIMPFLHYCESLHIPVVLSPVDSRAHIYASAVPIQNHCILAYDMTFEMTVVKVMLALGSHADIEQTLRTDNFFEKIR